MNKINTEHKLSAPSGTILCGDALTMLKTLPGESVDTCVCSPPYFGLRDYGHAEQIGVTVQRELKFSIKRTINKV